MTTLFEYYRCYVSVVLGPLIHFSAKGVTNNINDGTVVFEVSHYSDSKPALTTPRP